MGAVESQLLPDADAAVNPSVAPVVPTPQRRQSSNGNSGGQNPDSLDKLLELNRKWADDRRMEDPEFFDRLLAQQAPEYLWIGCADSRVPANVIMGLAPGEVFTQRNVGNQATHTDLNVMSCLEYGVTELKVKTIICCGHYGCGAVKAALRMPSKTQGLVNCWISDIRECRNQHSEELKALGSTEEQVNRLCELNVMRQTFHVCTSPVVQNAWDQGQELAVYGVVYSLKDGLVRKLVGPLTKENACLDIMEYEQSVSQSLAPGMSLSKHTVAKLADMVHANGGEANGVATHKSGDCEVAEVECSTTKLASAVVEHNRWSDAA